MKSSFSQIGLLVNILRPSVRLTSADACYTNYHIINDAILASVAFGATFLFVFQQIGVKPLTRILGFWFVFKPFLHYRI